MPVLPLPLCSTPNSAISRQTPLSRLLLLIGLSSWLGLCLSRLLRLLLWLPLLVALFVHVAPLAVLLFIRILPLLVLLLVLVGSLGAGAVDSTRHQQATMRPLAMAPASCAVLVVLLVGR